MRDAMKYIQITTTLDVFYNLTEMFWGKSTNSGFQLTREQLLDLRDSINTILGE